MNDKTALATTPQAHLLPAGADPNIDAQAIEDRLANRSANTTRAYTQAINEFNHWRQDAKITDGLIREYLHHLSARVSEQTGKPLSVATIRAKSDGHKVRPQSLGDRLTCSAQRVTPLYPELSGKRSQANTGRGQVTGIQHDPMVEIVVRCEIEDSMAGWRDAALIRTMFDGMLRISEACAAEVEHIEFATGGKTQRNGNPGDTALKDRSNRNRESNRVSFPRHCQSHKAVHGVCPHSRRPIVSRFHVQAQEPSHRTSQCQRSRPALPLKHGQKPLGSMGLFLAILLRVGTAQTLAEKGASLVEMQNAGRWKSSDMPAHYSRGQAAQKNAVAKYIYGQAENAIL